MGKSKTLYEGEEIVILKKGKKHYITPTEKKAVKAEVFEEVEVPFEKVSDYMKKNKTEKLEVVAIGKEADLKEPAFPDGISEFYKFVSKNFKIPNDFKGKGKIFASFIIEKDGSLTNIDIKKDLGSGTKEEAIRVLKSSPKWIPAKVNNETVRYQYVLPIQMTKE